MNGLLRSEVLTNLDEHAIQNIRSRHKPSARTLLITPWSLWNQGKLNIVPLVHADASQSIMTKANKDTYLWLGHHQVHCSFSQTAARARHRLVSVVEDILITNIALFPDNAMFVLKTAVALSISFRLLKSLSTSLLFVSRHRLLIVHQPRLQCPSLVADESETQYMLW